MSVPAGDGLTGRKRFYREAQVDESSAMGERRWRILLDGRPVRTPAKRELSVQNLTVATALAEEWNAQVENIDPRTMPLTRLINSAFDGVADRMGEVRDSVLAYGGSDLICYLADGPEDLLQRQSRQWGQIHSWVKQALNVELELVVGVMPVVQAPEMLARLDRAIGEPNALELAALHVITSTTGSLLLALAVLHGRLAPEAAWSLAHIDEDFQIEKWGADAEASLRRERRWHEMRAACLALRHGRAPPN